jgi:hypothetical protein
MTITAHPLCRATDTLRAPCPSVKVTQERGEKPCVRAFGHYALHMDDEGDTWF